MIDLCSIFSRDSVDVALKHTFSSLLIDTCPNY